MCQRLLQKTDYVERVLADHEARIRELGPEYSAWERASGVWGMAFDPSNIKLKTAKRYSASVKGDPMKDSALSIWIERDGLPIQQVWVKWDPKRYRVSKITDYLPLGKAVTLNEKFIAELPEKARADFKLRKDAIEALNSRVARALMKGDAPFSANFMENSENFQTTLEEFIRYQDILPVMQGKKPLRYLSQVDRYLGPPSAVLEKIYPDVKIFKTIVDHTETRWIRSEEEIPLSESMPLAVSTLLLALKENILFYKGVRTYGMPYASSVAVESGERSLYMNFLDIDAMKHLSEYGNSAPDTQWFTAHQQIQSYISRVYLDQLKLTEVQMKDLNRFTSENEDRLQYFFLTKEPPVLGNPVRRISNFPNATQPHALDGFIRKGSSGPFTVEGCFGMLTVSKSSQKFSMEAYSGYRPRYAEGEKVVELIRFGMDSETRAYGPKMVFQLSSYLMNAQGVDRVVLITAENYAKELVDRFGFRKVGEKIWDDGKTEWILEITPKDFAEKSLEKILEKF
jgi:hypothetical protein